MPDLRGKPLRQALATLAALRAEVELEGNGFVIRQTPEAGMAMTTDDPVKLTLARPGDTTLERAWRQPGSPRH